MLQPTDRPPASWAAAVGRLHGARAAAGDDREPALRERRARPAGPARTRGLSAGVRADPNTATARPTPASASNPSTNSDRIRSARQVSVSRNSGRSRPPSRSFSSSVRRGFARRSPTPGRIDTRPWRMVRGEARLRVRSSAPSVGGPAAWPASATSRSSDDGASGRCSLMPVRMPPARAERDAIRPNWPHRMGGASIVARPTQLAYRWSDACARHSRPASPGDRPDSAPRRCAGRGLRLRGNAQRGSRLRLARSIIRIAGVARRTDRRAGVAVADRHASVGRRAGAGCPRSHRDRRSAGPFRARRVRRFRDVFASPPPGYRARCAHGSRRGVGVRMGQGRPARR